MSGQGLPTGSSEAGDRWGPPGAGTAAAGVAGAPEWFLEALAAPVRTGTVEVEGCPIAFRRWGEEGRPSLVLVHGGGAHSRWWDHVAPFFVPDCCVTALDLSGHGDSGRRPAYSFASWAKEILAVASPDASGELPVVVGHSMGGFAAIQAAATYGASLEGIVVVDSPVRRPTPEEDASSQRRAFGPLRRYASEAEALSHFHPVPEQPVLLPWVVDHVARTSLRHADGAWTWKFDPAFVSRAGLVRGETLARAACRVAILRAERGLVTPDIGEHMYQLLGRRAPVIEIPLAHHHVMLDRPLLLVAALRALLADWRHSFAERRA